MSAMKLSICIVTLNAESSLRKCLRSLKTSRYLCESEIIVVDNNSHDQTVNMLEKDYPCIQLICNRRNEGFSKAINQAIYVSGGELILLLNPDTIVRKNTINELLKVINNQPEIGICGPKVLNEDQSFQKSCRRGLATPWNVFTYFSGLSRLFPHLSLFTGYHLSHIHEDQPSDVDGVSGSCMLIRRKLINEIGFFDDQYFAYQEDSDYCIRAKKRGWKIYFVPSSTLIHIQGTGGSNTIPHRSIYEWHRSYFLFYKKHYAVNYFFLFNFIFYLIMMLKLISTEIVYTLRS